MKKVTPILILIHFIIMSIGVRADISISNSSFNSLSISSKRLENDNSYILKIYVEGVKASSIKAKVINNKINIILQKGGKITGNAIAGGQYINYSYKFSKDADIKKFTRTNTDNVLTLIIPKF